MSGDAKPHFHEHRRRLRARFLEGGPDALADYELLELLLCIAIPQRDVKPLAKTLIARFGGFGGVISAAPERLLEVTGVGEVTLAALKTVQAAALRLLRERVVGQHVLGSWQKVLDYLTAGMAWRPDEEFRILFLNQKNYRLTPFHASATVSANNRRMLASHP